MEKDQLRKEYLQKRKKLTTSEVNFNSEKILNNIKRLNIWHNSIFHIFLPIEKQKEVNTWPIIHYIKDEFRKEIILPKTNFVDFSLEHIRYDNDTVLCENSLGILEPNRGLRVPEEKIEVVFVPLLTYDKNGNRVGYGKGFYDRFFDKCDENVLKIGLSFYNNFETIEDINEHDIPLDIIVTPDTIHEF